MEQALTLEEVLKLVQKLSPRDKLRLIEHTALEIERDLLPTHSGPRKPSWGLWSDLGLAPSTDEIDEMRREAWAGFPREDI